MIMAASYGSMAENVPLTPALLRLIRCSIRFGMIRFSKALEEKQP